MNDLPYLEPLLLHLRSDESLQFYFTENSFFMPKNTLLQASKEAMLKDCPAPRALWIIPESTRAVNPKAGCIAMGEHTFYILIFIHCTCDPFQLSKKNGRVELTGDFMELSKIRRAVKKSINEFENKNKGNYNLPFNSITYKGDTPLFPDEDNFIVSNTEYSVLLN